MIFLIITLGIGLYFVTLGIYQGIIESKQCSIKIEGQCLKHVLVSNYRNFRYYKIKFRYIYNNKRYNAESSNLIPEKDLDKFKRNQLYDIYIDPKIKRHIKTTNKIDKVSLFQIICGLFFLVTSLAAIFANI